jgi:RNA polymerase sigma factor (sigma-70 family)
MDVDWPGIVSRDGPVVWRTVYRLLGNRPDAEDCYQETFLSALDLWRRQPVRNSRAMLQRLATARAMDRLRSRYRNAARGTIPGISPECDQTKSGIPGPSELAASAELSARLREALATLPARQADVFCLFCLDGWSYQEIAGHLNITLDAVGVLLHRARAKLRLKLASLAPEKVI